MPKIKTICPRIEGQSLTIELHYSIVDKFCAKKLPEGMIDLPGARKKLLGIATLEELEKNVNEVAKVWAATQTKTRQVIIVHATINSKTRDLLGISTSHQLGHYGQQNHHGYDFNYQIAIETEFAGKKKYKNPAREAHHYDHTIIVDSKAMVIEYTEEREAVLKRLLQHTTKLGAMLLDFFGNDVEQFELNVDNGIKLLN